jgi:hypothetical protein
MPHQMVDTRTQTKKISARVTEICLVVMENATTPIAASPSPEDYWFQMGVLDTPGWMRFWWHFM